MIKFYKKSKLAKLTSGLLTALLLFFAQGAYAFPGGTYTIDRNSAASASNYLSFTAFANDLRNITRGDGGANQYAVGGAGVLGTIRVNVVTGSGPYTERMQLTQILGASATNRVIINGNGNTIQYTATAVNQATIEMNGTDFFTFNDLNILATEQSSVGGKNIWMYNSANFNVIKRCNLRRTFANTSQGSAYIWMNQSTSTSPFSYGDAGNDNLIDSCDLRSPGGNNDWGAFYGIIMFGPTSRSTGNATNRNTVSNCNVQDFWQRGIYFNYAGGITIKGNTIHNTGTTRSNTKYGIQGDYSDFNVDQNRIYNLNGNTPTTNLQYGVYFFSFASSGWVFNRSTYTNNVVHCFGTSTLYGSYFYVYGFYGHVLDIVGNTHSISHPTATNNNQCFPMYGGYWQGLFDNNILHFDMAGTNGMKQLMYDFNPANGNYRNNNWFFGSQSANQAQRFHGPQYQTNTSMQDMYNVGIPTNNVGFNPEFVDMGSNSLLIPTSLPMANKARVTTFTRDVVNATRSTTPDIGAYEYFVDLAITAFSNVFPVPTCAGYTEAVRGTVKNNGLYPIRNPRVAYSLNGAPQVEYSIPTILAPDSSVNFTFPVPQIFSRAGNNTIALRIFAPDDNTSNDQITQNFFVTPSPGGGEFSKDNSASSAFAQFIVSGKPDLTFPNEALVYQVTAPSRVGYSSSQYGTSGNTWQAFVSARTVNGVAANSLVTLTPASSSADLRLTFNANKSWEDSTFIVTYRVVNNATACDTTYTRRILVAPKAVPRFRLPQILCEKTDVYFENLSTVSSGSIESEWNFGDGSPISDEASPVHYYPNFGTYTVTLKTKTNPHGFVTDTTFNLEITEVPTALIVNTNACEGVSVRLRNGTVYGGSGSTTYTWDYGDNTGTTASNKNDLFKTYAAPGGYLVKLTATADGCSNSTQKFVYQFARPIAGLAKLSGECLNSEFSFQNNSGISQGLFGSEWDFNDAGNKSTIKNPKYNFQTAGTKNVRLKVTSEFGCEARDSMTVLVRQIPTTGFTYPFACSRTATPFTNTTNLNGETLRDYAWDFGDGFTSTASNPTKNWTAVGPKLVKLTTRLVNGCESSNTQEVSVGVQPNVSFDVEDRCAGSNVPFTNKTTYDQGQITYNWSFGDGNKSTVAAPVHAYGSGVSQTFSVKLKASIAGGCSDSLTKTVNISPLPSTCDFSIANPSFTTIAVPYTFTPKGGSSTGITYTWLTGDGGSVQSNGTGASYRYNQPGKYCVQMIARNTEGCECSVTRCITLTTNIYNAESMNNAVSVYPNPNSGIFNVALASEISSEMTVVVYNTIGELVKTIVVNNNQTVVDLSDVASGVYTVKVMADNQIATKKITIAK
jgi:parallel beta-helix repeat protein